VHFVGLTKKCQLDIHVGCRCSCGAGTIASR
jgi:hypothetical protein